MPQVEPHQDAFAFTTQPKPVERPVIVPHPAVIRAARRTTYVIALTVMAAIALVLLVLVLESTPPAWFRTAAWISSGVVADIALIVLIARLVVARALREHERRMHR
jgi:hypothetical protein